MSEKAAADPVIRRQIEEFNITQLRQMGKYLNMQYPSNKFELIKALSEHLSTKEGVGQARGSLPDIYFKKIYPDYWLVSLEKGGTQKGKPQSNPINPISKASPKEKALSRVLLTQEEEECGEDNIGNIGNIRMNIQCICGVNEESERDKTPRDPIPTLIKCMSCHTHQHLRCITPLPTTPTYECPSCQLRKTDPLTPLIYLLPTHQPTPCSNPTSNRDHHTHPFTLPKQIISLLHTQPGIHALQLRCLRISDTGRYVHRWPGTGVVYVNRCVQLDFRPQGNMGVGRKDHPCVVKNVKGGVVGLGGENTVEFLYKREEGVNYAYTMGVSKKISPEQLFNVWKLNIKSLSLCLKFVIELCNIRYKQMEDDECLMIKGGKYLGVNFRCQYSRGEISIPSRGTNCKHIQFFDLRNYISMNQNPRKWVCPICGEKAVQVYVDAYFLKMKEILRIEDAIMEEISIRKDASFHTNKFGYEYTNDGNFAKIPDPSTYLEKEVEVVKEVGEGSINLEEEKMQVWYSNKSRSPGSGSPKPVVQGTPIELMHKAGVKCPKSNMSKEVVQPMLPPPSRDETVMHSSSQNRCNGVVNGDRNTQNTQNTNNKGIEENKDDEGKSKRADINNSRRRADIYSSRRIADVTGDRRINNIKRGGNLSDKFLHKLLWEKKRVPPRIEDTVVDLEVEGESEYSEHNEHTEPNDRHSEHSEHNEHNTILSEHTSYSSATPCSPSPNYSGGGGDTNTNTMNTMNAMNTRGMDMDIESGNGGTLGKRMNSESPLPHTKQGESTKRPKLGVGDPEHSNHSMHEYNDEHSISLPHSHSHSHSHCEHSDHPHTDAPLHVEGRRLEIDHSPTSPHVLPIDRPPNPNIVRVIPHPHNNIILNNPRSIRPSTSNMRKNI